MSNTYHEELNRLIAAVERIGDIEAAAAKTNERMVVLQELLVAKSMEAMERQQMRVPTDEELDEAILKLVRYSTENGRGVSSEDIRSAMRGCWNFPGTVARVAASLRHLENCGKDQTEEGE